MELFRHEFGRFVRSTAAYVLVGLGFVVLALLHASTACRDRPPRDYSFPVWVAVQVAVVVVLQFHAILIETPALRSSGWLDQLLSTRETPVSIAARRTLIGLAFALLALCAYAPLAVSSSIVCGVSIPELLGSYGVVLLALFASSGIGHCVGVLSLRGVLRRLDPFIGFGCATYIVPWLTCEVLLPSFGSSALMGLLLVLSPILPTVLALLVHEAPSEARQRPSRPVPDARRARPGPRSNLARWILRIETRGVPVVSNPILRREIVRSPLAAPGALPFALPVVGGILAAVGATPRSGDAIGVAAFLIVAVLVVGVGARNVSGELADGKCDALRATCLEPRDIWFGHAGALALVGVFFVGPFAGALLSASLFTTSSPRFLWIAVGVLVVWTCLVVGIVVFVGLFTKREGGAAAIATLVLGGVVAARTVMPLEAWVATLAVLAVLLHASGPLIVRMALRWRS